MSVDLVYNVFYKHKEEPYYELSGPYGDQLAFYRKDWENCRLIRNGTDYIKIYKNYDMSKVIALNFLFDTDLNNIVLTENDLSYKLNGNYSNKNLEINWKWRRHGSWTSSYTLFDKNNKDRIYAKIERFTLKKERIGTLTIDKCVPIGFHIIIITSACLVWKLEQDKNTKKLRY